MAQTLSGHRSVNEQTMAWLNEVNETAEKIGLGELDSCVHPFKPADLLAREGIDNALPQDVLDVSYFLGSTEMKFNLNNTTTTMLKGDSMYKPESMLRSTLALSTAEASLCDERKSAPPTATRTAETASSTVDAALAGHESGEIEDSLTLPTSVSSNLSLTNLWDVLGL